MRITMIKHLNDNREVFKRKPKAKPQPTTTQPKSIK